MRVMNYVFVGILFVAFFILGQVCHNAWGFSDPFVARLELLFGVHPGEILPVDMRAPDVHLQYLRTTPVGHNCYQVNMCRR